MAKSLWGLQDLNLRPLDYESGPVPSAGPFGRRPHSVAVGTFGRETPRSAPETRQQPHRKSHRLWVWCLRRLETLGWLTIVLVGACLLPETLA